AHGAHRRFQYGTGGVLEAVARTHPRLFADDAVATHLLHPAIRVGDHPVAREQARRDPAGVAQLHRIGEDVAVGLGLRLVGDETCLHLHFDGVGRIFSHVWIVRLAPASGAGVAATRSATHPAPALSRRAAQA